MGDLDGASGDRLLDSLAGRNGKTQACPGAGAASFRVALDPVLWSACAGGRDQFPAHAVRTGRSLRWLRLGARIPGLDANGLAGRRARHGMVRRGLDPGGKHLPGGLARRSARAGRSSLDRLWLWFRDHWGVVWALRTQDRFNRTAELSGWPFRLTWFGLTPTDPAAGDVPITPPEEAEKVFRGLIRRFVDADRLDHLSRAR